MDYAGSGAWPWRARTPPSPQEARERERREKLLADVRLSNAGEAQAPMADIGRGLSTAGRLDGAQPATNAIDESTYARWVLESRRDSLRREAESIQALLDMLPTKIPTGATEALKRLAGK